MKLLNLIDSDKSDIKWRISRYPDGQIHLELLDDIDRKSLRYRLINIIRIWDIHPENRHFLFNSIARVLRLRMVW